MHYVETIFGPAIAKYTKKTDDASISRENDSYNDTNISTTRKKETDNNDIKNEVENENKTATDDDTHHIEVIEVGTHIRPEVAAELNRTLWKNVNMTVLDAIVQTWLLSLEHKDLNQSVETESITTAENILSGTLNDVFNVTYTNVSIYTTENPINNAVTKEIKIINTLTESPISEKMLRNLDEGIIRRKKSNSSYISKNYKKELPKLNLNLSEVSNASESDEEFSIKIKTTQTLDVKDKKKGVPKTSSKPVTKIVPPSTTTVFATKTEIITTTEMLTTRHVSENSTKGWEQFENLDSTDVSQVSEETYEEPTDDLKGYENKYVKKGLMSLQPESDIIHNFLDLSKEELNEDSRNIEISEKNFKSKNLKKGLSKSIHIYHQITTTEETEHDIAFEGETTEQYTTEVTTDKVTATTEEYLSGTTEKNTNTTEQLPTGITEEVTQSDDIESSTKLNNVAKNLILTTGNVGLLEVAKKGVEGSIEDVEEKSEDSLDSEKEQVVYA